MIFHLLYYFLFSLFGITALYYFVDVDGRLLRLRFFFFFLNGCYCCVYWNTLDLVVNFIIFFTVDWLFFNVNDNNEKKGTSLTISIRCIDKTFIYMHFFVAHEMYAFFEIFMCTLLTYVRTNMQQKVVALCGFLGLKSLSNTF